jgi:Domain of unknown function (DUF4123)
MMNTAQKNIPEYMLLDGAKILDELDDLLKKSTRHACLYKGGSERSLASVAPYVAFVAGNEKFLSQVHTDGWGAAWGILFSAYAGLDELVYHFRKFLMVETEEGKQLYFRFYDPRVLRTYLPTCDEKQLTEFFGPVRSFFCESEDPASAIVFSLENKKLKTETINAASLFSDSAKAPERAPVSAPPPAPPPAGDNKTSPPPDDKPKRSFIYTK